MATERYNVCSACGNKQSVTTLFKALYDISRGREARCSKCDKKSVLELTFGFGRGTSPHQCKVLAVFLPKHIDRWKEGRFNRSFYPFLVIVKSKANGHRSVWLPYWHIDRRRRQNPRVKYGQWASFIRESPFASLVGQAKTKGYKITHV
jgi:hypothetical protein